MFSVEIINLNNFSKMKEYWEKLEKGKDMTPFQSYFWYEKINEYSIANGNEKNDFYAVAKLDSNPVMIAPIHIINHGISVKGFGIEKGIYILGTSTHTDYLSFIYDEFYPEAVEAIIDYVKKKCKLNNFFFEEIIENTEFDKYLSANSDKYNCATCVEIVPAENFDVYKKSLSKSVRQNLRTAVNRANKDGYELDIDIINCISTELAQKLYGIYQSRTATKNSVSQSSVKDMIIGSYYQRYNKKLQQKLDKYNYLVNAMSTDNKNNLIIIIKANNEPIGFCYGLKSNNKVSIMTVSFNEEYSKYSPGMVGIFKYIENDYLSGSPLIFDLTRGNEQYKYKLGGTEHFLNYYK
ncbi:MAG: GNAT family N-acetyltransferase, partial [Ruminococcus sp.]|nr:GNAT family N-acetyltransferase [Candidatus Copronaster equi]